MARSKEEIERIYLETSAALKRNTLQLRAYKNRLERFLDPGSAEWMAECDRATELELEHDKLLKAYALARFEYNNACFPHWTADSILLE